MSIQEKIRDLISNTVPFKVFAVFVYVLFILFSILWVIFLPLIYLYKVVLCLFAWSVMPSRGKDVVVVRNGNADSELWLSQVMALVERRAYFLNYEDNRKWPRWSLEVLLFRAFGPSPMPPSFMPHCLPAVVVVRKFRWPARFSFGARQIDIDKETNLANFRASLN
jgi:hypothetical protein